MHYFGEYMHKTVVFLHKCEEYAILEASLLVNY